MSVPLFAAFAKVAGPSLLKSFAAAAGQKVVNQVFAPKKPVKSGPQI